METLIPHNSSFSPKHSRGALQFIVVENRTNKSITACIHSAKTAGIQLSVIDSIQESDEFTQVRKKYVHLSTNPPEFELVCIRRYFLLRDFLESNPEVYEFVLCDSDILFFKGIQDHIPHIINGRDFLGCYIQDEVFTRAQISPHLSYWSKQALFDFTNFIAETYSSNNKIGSLKSIQEDFQAKGIRGGVSDMTLLFLWAKQRGALQPLNLALPSGTLDHNINTSHNLLSYEFRTLFGIKKIKMLNGKPHLVQRETASLIPVFALHFQGRSKILMPILLKNRLYLFHLMAFAVTIAKVLKNGLYRLSTN